MEATRPISWVDYEKIGSHAEDCDRECASEFRALIEANLGYWRDNGIQQIEIPCLPPCHSYEHQTSESSERNLVRAGRVTQALTDLGLLCGNLQRVDLRHLRNGGSSVRYGVTVTLADVGAQELMQVANAKAQAIIEDLTRSLERGERIAEETIVPLAIPSTHVVQGELLAFVYGHDTEKHRFKEPFASRRLEVVPKTDALFKRIVEALNTALVEEQTKERAIIWKVDGKNGNVQIRQFPKHLNKAQAFYYRSLGWHGTAAITKAGKK